jgi:hypothetical protein
VEGLGEGAGAADRLLKARKLNQRLDEVLFARLVSGFMEAQMQEMMVPPLETGKHLVPLPIQDW